METKKSISELCKELIENREVQNVIERLKTSIIPFMSQLLTKPTLLNRYSLFCETIDIGNMVLNINIDFVRYDSSQLFLNNIPNNIFTIEVNELGKKYETRNEKMKLSFTDTGILFIMESNIRYNLFAIIEQNLNYHSIKYKYNQIPVDDETPVKFLAILDQLKYYVGISVNTELFYK